MVLGKEEIDAMTPELDGGAAGSGLDTHLTHDPTQGKGTTAWQRAVQHSIEFNARDRRN